VAHILLLAEASLAIQRVVQLTFANEDVEVVIVSNGTDALAQAERLRPSIVVADVTLARHNGYELASLIKKHPRLCGVPVVLLSGAFERVDSARATEAGCDLVLTKPFDPLHLLAQVEGLIEGAGASLGMTEKLTAAVSSEEEHLVPGRMTPPFAGAGPPTVALVEPGAGQKLSISGFPVRRHTVAPPAPLETDLPPTELSGSVSIDDAYDALMRQLREPKPRAFAVALRADDVMLVERAVERVIKRLDPAIVREALEEVVVNMVKRVIQEEVEPFRRP
jgi:CheY-like chemotaxis protein